MMEIIVCEEENKQDWYMESTKLEPQEIKKLMTRTKIGILRISEIN